MKNDNSDFTDVILGILICICIIGGLMGSISMAILAGGLMIDFELIAIKDILKNLLDKPSENR